MTASEHKQQKGARQRERCEEKTFFQVKQDQNSGEAGSAALQHLCPILFTSDFSLFGICTFFPFIFLEVYVIMYRTLYSTMFLVLLGAILWGHSYSETRVVSGRKVCYADYKHPCYKIAYFQDLTARVGYQQAHQVCEGEGGHLLSIESEAEQKLIERMLQNLTNSGSGKSDGDFWIGFSRNLESTASSGACPDLYKWTDGTTSKFMNWYADEPSCGSEACVVMYHQPTANPGIGGPYMYQWNDDRCNMKHNFICKYPSENILDKELGDRANPEYDPLSPVTTDLPFATGRPDDSSHVVVAETGIMPNLIYVIIPTIPLLLLILVAFGTCCFQTLHKSKERSKTSPTQSTLWISKAPRSDITMEV